MKYCVFFLALVAQTSYAFHIDDHKTIMHQAYTEMAACFPQAQALLSLEWLSDGDAAEDEDLWVKWTEYSHYYNPYKHLNMIRADSSARIEELAPMFRHTGTITSDEMDDLGHAIHHLQDMAVPAHVVPVSHWLFDGFETYAFTGDISSGWTCEDITTMQQSDLLTILNDTSEQTLANITNSKLTFVGTVGPIQNTVQTNATAFWQGSNNDDFGQYGYLGNNFGSSNFQVGNITYQVPASYYQSFKQAQMKLAVRASIRGLLWELGPNLTPTIAACEK